MSDESRVVLVGTAKAAHDRVLAELQRDERISINSSKLVNWIVLDYCERYLAARKKHLAKAHFSERKCFEAAMKIEDPEERRRALREAARSLAPSVPRQKKERAQTKENRAASEEND